MASPPAPSDARLHAQQAATLLAEAIDQAQRLHHPGERDRHRQRLERTLELIAAARRGHLDPETLERVRVTQAVANALRAEDARHGAGQLSQSAQRAPTHEGCDEGWARVAQIVATSEAAAREASRVAAELDHPRVREAAEAATVAALDARRLLDDRNHAYTFHTDPRFSFGEGWYLAAAGILCDVTIQIQPDQPQTPQAERFLRDAGLGPNLVPYRSRPRASKALPDLVARAFRADPRAAQATLRARFLGGAPIDPAIVEWTADKLAEAPAHPKVLVWLRYGAYHPTRNTTYDEVLSLCEHARRHGLVPIVIGDALRGGELPTGTLDLTLFWKHRLFQGIDMRRAQLQLFELLTNRHQLRGQLGVTTAGMDGPALMGLPTAYLTPEPNDRLGKWVGAIPGYHEIVRDPGYLDRIAAILATWTR